MPKACEADFADDMHKHHSGAEKKKDRFNAWYSHLHKTDEQRTARILGFN